METNEKILLVIGLASLMFSIACFSVCSANDDTMPSGCRWYQYQRVGMAYRIGMSCDNDNVLDLCIEAYMGKDGWEVITKYAPTDLSIGQGTMIKTKHYKGASYYGHCN